MKITRPMLAASLLNPHDRHDDDTVFAAMKRLKKWPKIATFKEDGIRGYKKTNLLSRSLKLIPNKSIQDRAIRLPSGFDVELSNRDLPYYQIESIVMSREHSNSDAIKFYILDWFSEHEPYLHRLRKANQWATDQNYSDVMMSSYIICENAESLFAYEKWAIEQMGEGICFRPINSLYVQKRTIDNRATLAEETLIKLARYIRQEVTVIGFEEQEKNNNRTYSTELGGTKRSASKAYKIGKDTLGAFIVKNKEGLVFNVGTGVGLTDKKRQEIWNNQDKYIGTLRVIKHKACGAKTKPRSPIDLGARNEIDL